MITSGTSNPRNEQTGAGLVNRRDHATYPAVMRKGRSREKRYEAGWITTRKAGAQRRRQEAVEGWLVNRWE